jgi:hypothetical protein
MTKKCPSQSLIIVIYQKEMMDHHHHEKLNVIEMIKKVKMNHKYELLQLK